MRMYFLNKVRWLSHAAYFMMGYGFAVNGVVIGILFMVLGFVLDIVSFKIAQNKNSSAIHSQQTAGRFPS